MQNGQSYHVVEMNLQFVSQGGNHPCELYEHRDLPSPSWHINVGVQIQ